MPLMQFTFDFDSNVKKQVTPAYFQFWLHKIENETG